MARKDMGLALLLALILLFSLPAASRAAEDPDPSALAAILMDRRTGRVLWAKNSHQQLAIASTTKIMTAILALEYGREDDLVVVSKAAADTEGSSIWLEAGEEKTLRELIYGLLLRSGNDAAVAIAEHLAGSVDNFCVLMNSKARELGALNTCFANPHGLPHDHHYSTAYDLAIISAYALHNDRFREIIATPEYTISWPGHPWDRALGNQNRLLEIYPGGDGIKTGWTKKAGRCFVGSATREGWQLIVVVLNAPEMWEDAVELLDYGFNTFTCEKVLYQGQVVLSAPVLKGQSAADVAVSRDFYFPLLPGERSQIRFHFILNQKIKAPLSAGSKVGEVEIYLQDQLIGKVDLHAGRAVKKIPVLIHFFFLWETFCQ